ncbi:MAG: YitT family protein [Eubacteriales bacterium]|nr:YitT family protein [Eubacteriales bacterium]
MKAVNLKTIKEYMLVTLGTLLLIAGIYFFKFPNNFTTGGVSGISLVLGSIVPGISSGMFVLITNMALLAIGFIFVGGSFGIKTIYSSVLFSVGIVALEKIYPMSAPFTDQPFMELTYAVLLTALGSSIIFNTGASSGGTDIIAMILKKYTEIDIGKALLLSDGLIAASAFFVFGAKTGMFSLMGLIIKTTAIDIFIENFTLCKFFIIVTTKSDEICDYIMKIMHHGATVSDAEGAFTHTGKKLVMVACKRAEALSLRKKVKEIDHDAFTFITNTSEIIGKGFRQ